MAEKLEWQNERRRLGDLIPWETNPRVIYEKEAERLVNSLDQFGQVETFAIGPENEVYDGHQRKAVWAAVDRYGADYEVDVRVANRPLTEAERKKLVIYLHRGTIGAWDFDILANNFELDDLLAWGFEKKDLDIELWSGSSVGNGGVGEDRAAIVQEKWGVKVGQIWQLGDYHRLICGSCTDRRTVQRLMDGDPIDYVFTSPPYGIDLDYEKGESLESLVELIRECIYQINESAAPDCYATMNYSDVFRPGEPGFTLMSQYYNDPFQELGWCLRGNRVWAKPFGRLSLSYGRSTTMNLREWEYVQTWRKGRGKERLCNHAITLRGVWYSFGENAILDDWRDFDQTEDKEVHQAAFPLLLPIAGIRAYTDPGAFVYEPFSGTGTVIIACEQTGRKARAVEIKPEFCALALERYAVTTGIDPVVMEGIDGIND